MTALWLISFSQPVLTLPPNTFSLSFEVTFHFPFLKSIRMSDLPLRSKSVASNLKSSVTGLSSGSAEGVRPTYSTTGNICFTLPLDVFNNTNRLRQLLEVYEADALTPVISWVKIQRKLLILWGKCAAVLQLLPKNGKEIYKRTAQPKNTAPPGYVSTWHRNPDVLKKAWKRPTWFSPTLLKRHWSNNPERDEIHLHCVG